MKMETLPTQQQPAEPTELVTFAERRERLYQRLSERPDHVGMPTRKIAFLSTERSGSSFLCDALDNTGQFGIPDEYFSLKYINSWARLHKIDERDIDLDAYLDFLFRKTTSANGVFSVKIHAYQHAKLKKQGVEFFDLGFDQVYKITRRNKVSQAFSFAKADLTKAWQSGDKPIAKVEVQFTQICRYLQVLAEYDSYMTANTDRFCHDTIVYEDFIGPQQLEIFNRILAQNGCATVSAMQTSLKKQSKPDDEARIAMFSQWLGIQSSS
jgi:LPS sulfotransferase NodH